MSDGLCRLAPGGGLRTRALFTDDEETLFDAKRPVIINGIEQAGYRADFVDRCVVVDTKVIPVFDYQEEAPFWAEFENDHPKLLGVILDGVGAALKNLPTTKLTKKPRMADFTTFSVAAEPGLGFEPGTFFKAYIDNRGAAVETTLQAYPIVPYLEEIGGFDGEFADLLDKLDALQAVDSLKRPKFWPETPRKLSADLKRIAPALRAKGHDCAISEPGRTRQRTISFSFCPDPHKSKNTSATSATSANDTQVGENNKSNSADVCPSAKPHTSATSAETSAESLFDRQFADVCPADRDICSSSC
jgi:hypothetical protein